MYAKLLFGIAAVLLLEAPATVRACHHRGRYASYAAYYPPGYYAASVSYFYGTTVAVPQISYFEPPPSDTRAREAGSSSLRQGVPMIRTPPLTNHPVFHLSETDNYNFRGG